MMREMTPAIVATHAADAASQRARFDPSGALIAATMSG
jgi:hypothetical protein